MSKKLVLAEKPSVGKDIAKVLGCAPKGNGFCEGPQYIVTWALGHLVTLADPETYDNKYQQWRIEDLPMLPVPLKLEVIKKTGSQYRTVKELMLRKDVTEIIIATDAGREGELVARWIIEKAGVKKPIKRLWISSVTDKAIKEGFSKLKDGKAYEPLYASAFARSAADWYVGMNATRALTCKFNAQLSCGRVQTPTLAMIAHRENEIQSFKPKAFYGIHAQTSGTQTSGTNSTHGASTKPVPLRLTWTDAKSQSTQSFDESRISGLLKSLSGQDAIVKRVDKAEKKSFAPALYDLTELQRDANRLYEFSAKETLSLMQRLYEQHKILTYPRTDSRYLSSDIVDTLKDRLKACGVGPYATLAFKVSKSPLKLGKSVVDDSKVSDHHAIIPTEQRVSLNALTPDERKIYDLVVKRFLAALLPPFVYEQTRIEAQIGTELFKAKGKRVLDNGWKEAYENIFDDDDEGDDLKEQLLPELHQGDRLKVIGLNMTKGMTSPPPLFTEGTLLSAMEKPAKFMAEKDTELARILGETGGIGTVATRADIIEKLLGSFLIEKKGKHLQITSKGKQLLELVPEDLKSPALTAKWEKELEAIAKGVRQKDAFINDMKDYTKTVVNEIKNSQEKFKHDNVTRDKCPECGKYLLEVNGKKGKMLVCQDRECGYRKGVSRATNARCPNCHKKMDLKGSGENKVFACACGYREKLSAFNKRREESSNKGNIRDVKKYLEEQKKEEDNYVSPLAEALAKLKL